jgi:hypothetical protein
LIRDYKTTTSFNWDSYYFSWQWKVYLLLANRKEFVYDVFTRKLDEKDLPTSGILIDNNIAKILNEDDWVEQYPITRKPYVNYRGINVCKILASKTMFITEYNEIKLFHYKNMKKDVEDIITWYFDVLTALTDDFVRIAIENNIKIKGLIE